MSKIDRYENINVRQEGSRLIIEIETDDAKVDVRPSSSGKSLVLATTGGARQFNGISINLTVYRKR